MIIHNTSKKLISIGICGGNPVRILPDEEAIIPDADANTTGVKTLQSLNLIEIRREIKPEVTSPVADELPVQPKPAEEVAEAPQQPAAKTTKKAAAGSKK